MEPIAHLVINSARRHRPPRVPDDFQKPLAPFKKGAPQQKKRLAGARELGRPAEPAVLPVVLGGQFHGGHIQDLFHVPDLPAGAGPFSQDPEPPSQLLRPALHFAFSLFPGRGDLPEHVDKTGPAVRPARRKIGSAIKRLSIRRQPDRKGPSSLSRQSLHGRHVNPVDVGPLLPVHLHRDELPVENLRGLLILERLPLHHVTPVAGRITNAQEHGSVSIPGLFPHLRPPRHPCHRIVRVLEQVGTDFPGQRVGFFQIHSISTFPSPDRRANSPIPSFSSGPSP